MNKKIAYSVVFVGLFLLTSLAFAQSIENPIPGVSNFGDLICKIAFGVGALVGSIGTLMLIISGILFLFSARDPGRMQTAKTALTYAIIGMVIGLAAGAIVTTISTMIGGSGSC